jgi:uncharacterized protein (DUF697 family)
MKKTLPKAIRPDSGHGHGPAPSPPIAEPLPETSRYVHAASETMEPALDETTGSNRKMRARKLVERFSLWSGAAGLFPVPVADLAVIAGVQLQMLRRLSQLYDVPFSKNRGKALIASFAGTMIPASTGLGVSSFMKTVPIAGTAIGALTTPALSVGATYMIGLAFVQHFESGGTLFDFDPPDYEQFIKGGMMPGKA